MTKETVLCYTGGNQPCEHLKMWGPLNRTCWLCLVPNHHVHGEATHINAARAARGRFQSSPIDVPFPTSDQRFQLQGFLRTLVEWQVLSSKDGKGHGTSHKVLWPLQLPQKIGNNQIEQNFYNGSPNNQKDNSQKSSFRIVRTSHPFPECWRQ